MSKYLIFESAPSLLPMEDSILIRARKTGIVLGRIEYYLSWQQHVFVPSAGSAWSWECLADVEAKLKEMNKTHG
jgi:hypothetical protein